jgi:micrococcal nuclease
MRALALFAAVLLLAAACADTTEAPDPSRTPSPAASATATPSTGPTVSVRPDLTPARVTRVVDGDTIEVEVNGTEYTVRYIGIDTPETVHPDKPVQCFGPEASARNKDLVEGETVGLERDVSETDRYGRLLRYVWVGDEMVNAALVRDGFAQVSTYPPDVRHQDMFLQLQREAREASRGLWGAICASASPTPGPGGPGTCDFSGTSQPVIKGNISRSSGERIYHVPGGQYYDETVIDETAGERWFCTEQEAIEAGWRRSKV